MKRVFLPIIAMLIVVLLGICGSAKKVAYFQNIDTTSLVASRGLYDAKILPKDLLTITVSTTDPQASLPFNLVVYNSLNSSGSLGGGGGMLQSYLVDNDGYIQFPVLGNHIYDNIIKSPYSYLQQNDLVYVEPNGTKSKNSAIGQSTTLWFSLVSILTSVAALVVNIVRN